MDPAVLRSRPLQPDVRAFRLFRAATSLARHREHEPSGEPSVVTGGDCRFLLWRGNSANTDRHVQDRPLSVPVISSLGGCASLGQHKPSLHLRCLLIFSVALIPSPHLGPRSEQVFCIFRSERDIVQGYCLVLFEYRMLSLNIEALLTERAEGFDQRRSSEGSA